MMLWNIRVPRRQKLILMAIFSVVVVVIIVAIVRVVLVNSTQRNADITWLYFWSNIEMTTCMLNISVRLGCMCFSLLAAIIIACVASFRQLFVNTNNQRKQPKASGSSSRRGLLSYLKYRYRSTRKGKSGIEIQDGDSSDRWGSKTHIVPLDSIHVGYNLSVPVSKFGQDEHEAGMR